MFSGVWAETSFHRLASHWPPIIVQLWISALPVRVKQYPISREGEVVTRNHISLHRDASILELKHSIVPCHSIRSGVRRIWESRNYNCFKQLHLTLPVGSKKNCTHCPVPERYLFSLYSRALWANLYSRLNGQTPHQGSLANWSWLECHRCLRTAPFCLMKLSLSTDEGTQMSPSFSMWMISSLLSALWNNANNILRNCLICFSSWSTICLTGPNYTPMR